MNTWICRLLTFVFLLNCLPVQTWADARTPKRKRAAKKNTLEEQVAERVLFPYDSWLQEKAELDQVLANTDLSSLERQFADLEQQLAQTRIDSIDIYDKDPLITPNRANAIYGARIKALEEREKDLEKQQALRTFYMSAQADSFVAATIYAMHKHAAASWQKAQQQDAAFAQRDPVAQQERIQQRQNEMLVQRTDAIQARTPVEQPRVVTPQAEAKALFDKYEKNQVTLEQLVELADPVVTDPDKAPHPATRAAAAELLFLTFYGFNHAKDNTLDPQSLDNATWLAKRLKYRSLHQLYTLEQKAKGQAANSLTYAQARGNLMLLHLQVKAFLAAHPGTSEEATTAQYDQKLEQYALIQDELSAYRPGVWTVSKVGAAIVDEIKQTYTSAPSQDSAQFSLLATNLSYAVRFLLVTNQINPLIDLAVLINKDKKTFHGKNEAFVSAFYASLFDTLINYSISEDTQQKVKQLLVCSAAPKCTFGNEEKTNAVNVRVQALAVGSMLRQVAKSGKLQTDDIMRPQEVAAPTLNKALFNDQTFRSAMAAYTVDVYYPMQKWEVSNNNVERYGMSVEEIQKLSNYLANIFETFLPVPEPKATFKKITEGVYQGCITREMDPKKLVSLNSLAHTRNGSITQATSIHGEPCNQMSTRLYGGFDNAVVTDSNGYLRGMTSLNRYNRERAMQDFAEGLVTEVATWYLWGIAFRGLGYLWKGLKAASAAGRAAVKASNGMRIMRFESKFAQVWKYSTNGWKAEMGLVQITKTGDKMMVEMARPGYQAYVTELSESVLQGHSLNTLKGRILLRRALQRNIYANVGKTAQAMNITAATGSTRLLGTVSDDLANELARPLTKAEQATVRNEQAVVNAVKQELAEGTSFETIAAANGGPATLYRPLKMPEPLIDLTTGLPEKVTIDPITGNVSGMLSGNYAGTIVTPFTQNTVAYNIAAGITHAPSDLFTLRLMTNQFPVLQQLNGLTKFVLGLTALNQPMYYLYTKPYMQRVAREQETALTQQTGFNKDEVPAAEPKTTLDQIQGLTSTTDDTSGAAMTGMFLGVNQLLNTVLPTGIQAFRQDLFKQVTNLVSKIDDPLAEALGASGDLKINEFLPLPGQVLSFPFVLAGDPTPATTTGAGLVQYQNAAHQQQVAHAMDQHNITVFKQNIDTELTALETSLPQFLQQNKDLLQALPKATKEIKTAYKVYEQSLKKAKALIEKDADQAADVLKEAGQKFIYTQADIMERCIQATIPQARAKDIAALTDTFKQSMDMLFTQQDEQRLVNMVTEYYQQYGADLIQFYTADKRALQTGQNAQVLQAQAEKDLQKHNAAFKAHLQAFDQEMTQRVQNEQNRRQLIAQFIAQWEQDYKDMTPYYISYARDLSDELQAIYDEFTTNLNYAFETITDSKALQAKYNQLVTKRNAQFNTLKQYWTNQDPQWEWLFKNTISSMEKLYQTEQPAPAQ